MSKKPSVLPSNAITSEDILGKDVLDKDGVNVGVVDRLFIEPDSISVLGLSVDKGFLRDGLLIGTEHIAEVTEHAIFLKIRPAYRLQGAHVFDKDGDLVGAIVEVALNQTNNTIEEIVVKKRFRKARTITKEFIASVDENIVLNCDVEQLP